MTTPNSLMQVVTWRENVEGKAIYADEGEVTGGFGATIHIRCEELGVIFGKIPEKLHIIVLEEI